MPTVFDLLWSSIAFLWPQSEVTLNNFLQLLRNLCSATPESMTALRKGVSFPLWPMISSDGVRLCPCWGHLSNTCCPLWGVSQVDLEQWVVGLDIPDKNMWHSHHTCPGVPSKAKGGFWLSHWMGSPPSHVIVRTWLTLHTAKNMHWINMIQFYTTV
jgi:hypothetical protein